MEKLKTDSTDRIKICNINKLQINTKISVCGWIKSTRKQRTFSFLEINDGSCFSNLQVIIESTCPNFQELSTNLTTGASVQIEGTLEESAGHKQTHELKASSIKILGLCDPEEYPLQKKRHSFEFLRTIAHLRPRTNTQGATIRVRNALSFATHSFFQELDFLYINTPIISTSDCEGSGEQFLVTSLNLDKLPTHSDKKIDFSKDFFQKPAYLTVSGQLNAEAIALALSDVYTFGPTFRAENSNTSRHLAEFWMIEPEMAFADINKDIELAEKYVKYVLNYTIKRCHEDIEFFNKFIDPTLSERLDTIVNSSFERISYTDAISILEKSNQDFTFPVKWGLDLQSEHERYLTEKFFKKPTFVTDYPKKIKAFYMKGNEDGKTVAAMDLLLPKIGELIGGSQREDDLEKLEKNLLNFNLDPANYWWYVQLRKFGSVEHSGFGLGLERLVLLATGLDNIRDVILFPRYPGHADF